MPPKYDSASIMRALDAHKARGLIRHWRPAPGASTGVFRAQVDLVGGESGFELRTAREASIFVHALASAHHAQLRREQPTKPESGILWQPEHLAGHAPFCAHPGSHGLMAYCSATPAEPETMLGRPSKAWLRDHPQNTERN